MRRSSLRFTYLTCSLAIFLLVAYTLPSFAQKKKILIVVTSVDYLPNKANKHTWGCYTPEVSNFFARMYSAGYVADDIDIVSLNGGIAPLAGEPEYVKKYNVPDDQKKTLRAKLNACMKPDDVNPDNYNVIYYAGGLSCVVDFPTSVSIANIAAQIYEHGGIVAAVCDGVSGLLPIKLSTGKYLIDNKMISINNFDKKIRDSLSAEGAILADDKLSVSHKVITAKGVRPIEIAEKVLTALGSPS